MLRSAKSSLLITATIAAALSACGGSTTSSAPTTAISADLVVDAISGLRLDKSQYTAAAGEISVAYVNEDTIRHTLVVVQDGNAISGFTLKVNQKGDVDTGQITLQPGVYVLLCTVPGHQNMKADLTVK